MARSRTRKSALDARAEILAAAERRLIEGGPAGLRLQELAAEVGVSHPAILHHFKSREGLVQAVVEHAVQKLQDELVRAIGGARDGKTQLELVYDVLATRGHARLMAWLLLSGYEPLAGEPIRAKWREIIDATHRARSAGSKGKAPARDDTAFTVSLSALAMFGLAITGASTFRLAGLGHGPRADAKFLTWFAELLGNHLAS